MTRFVTQLDDYSCGPVAILNAAKFYNFNFTIKKDLKRLKEKCHCEPKHGSYHKDIDLALRDELCNVQIDSYPYPLNVGFNEIKEHFKSNGTMLFSFGYKEKKKVFGHIIFVSKYRSKSFLVHNKEQSSSEWISFKTMKRLLSSHCIEEDGTEYPHIWLLNKKEKHDD